MAHHIAAADTANALARLKVAIKEAGQSLRSLERLTQNLDTPERMHHANLSEILRGLDGRDMYLQTYLAACSILGRHPVALLSGEDAGLVAESLEHLDAHDRAALLGDCLKRLEDRNARATLRMRLRTRLRELPPAAPATSETDETQTPHHAPG